MKKYFAIAYIVCIHVFLGFVLLKSGYLESVLNKLGHGLSSQQEITEYYYDMVGYHSRMDGNVPNGTIIFIGDSFIQGLCVSAVVPESVNYGIGGDTTFGVLNRLPKYRSLSQAGAVVVAIGFNDLKFRNNEEILRNYSAIADQIPKKIPIIFSAILPIDEEKRKNMHGKNQRIKSINIRLKALTMNSGNQFFIDVGPSLIDKMGNLDDAYQDGDGIHLNSKGNAIWVNELRKIIIQANRLVK